MPSWPAHGWLLLLALSVQVVGWLLISTSLPRLPAAVTSVVLTIQPVGAVLLGIWLLGEAPSAFQLLGVLFILAGLLLTTLRVRSAEARRGAAGDGLRLSRAPIRRTRSSEGASVEG